MPRSWPASGRRPRRRHACSTRTSSRSTRWASRRADPFFSLEFIEGGNLAKKLAGKPLPWREAAELLETLARTMHYAHENAIVHRDLKPANILLTATGSPKVTDFGLAKILDQDTGQTRSGQLLGTPAYMAPEQAAGRLREVGPATDTYALGVILYEMLTGGPPFRGGNLGDILRKIEDVGPVPPRRLDSALPRNLETICLKCLEKSRPVASPPPQPWPTTCAASSTGNRSRPGRLPPSSAC